MKFTKYTAVLSIVFILFLSGCGDDKTGDTGIEFAPQMYHSIPIEPYTQRAGFKMPLNDSLNALDAPKGTFAVNAREFADEWWHEDMFTGEASVQQDEREKAAEILKNPVQLTDEVLAEGQILYERFCAVCHGKKGLGDGPVPTKSDGAYPPPTKFNAKDKYELPEGEIYYNITYGKNAMWSYAAQMTDGERWKVVHYVQTLLKPVEGEGDDSQDEEEMDADDSSADMEMEEGMDEEMNEDAENE